MAGLGMLCLAPLLLSPASQASISWQGYTWHVRKASHEGPGPNDFDPANVWIDSKGFLHLRIAQVNGRWACAELETDRPLGFGTYQCQVEGRLDKLDPNVVFSMFSYAGPDGIKEIDVEFARWGNPKSENASWTVYPNDLQGHKKTREFELRLDGSYTTSRYLWSSTGVHYWMLGGHQPNGSLKNLLQEWSYQPANAMNDVTQTPMPLHFNLWLFEGRPPADGKPVEVVVHSFTRTVQ